MEWFCCRYGFILTLSIFIQILFILRLATMSPCKIDTPHLWIIKDKLGDKRYERECWFLFTYIVLIQSDIYLAETNITFKQQYTFKFYKYTFKQHQAQATKYFEVQATSMTSCRCKYNAQYNLQLSLSYFLLMLLTESFCIYSFQLHQSSSQLLVENALTYFCFTLNNYLVYCYASSTHCIYLFTFNSDILSFGM